MQQLDNEVPCQIIPGALDSRGRQVPFTWFRIEGLRVALRVGERDDATPLHCRVCGSLRCSRALDARVTSQLRGNFRGVVATPSSWRAPDPSDLVIVRLWRGYSFCAVLSGRILVWADSMKWPVQERWPLHILSATTRPPQFKKIICPNDVSLMLRPGLVDRGLAHTTQDKQTEREMGKQGKPCACVHFCEFCVLYLFCPLHPTGKQRVVSRSCAMAQPARRDWRTFLAGWRHGGVFTSIAALRGLLHDILNHRFRRAIQSFTVVNMKDTSFLQEHFILDSDTQNDHKGVCASVRDIVRA